ncbi:MAG: hypothetical protein IH892_22350 [Planctomycetes bacterium]|nr:hypothetical protein [Planctomycetota bacterium]
MKKLAIESGDFTARFVKNNIRLLGWVFAWVATMVFADKAELYQWYSSDFISIVAIVINAGIGIGMIVTYVRFLKESDELQRKIQLDALALAMGIGLVGSFTYSLLVTAKFIIDAEISDIILLMVLTYIVGIIVGQVRYR